MGHLSVEDYGNSYSTFPMVTVDEIKARQARIQQKERELAEHARKLDELQKSLQQESKQLHEISERFQRDQVKKMEETKKIADQLKRSDVTVA